MILLPILLVSDKFDDREDFVDDASAMEGSYIGRNPALSKYNYLDRDLKLPIQIHQNATSYRDSPDQGKLTGEHFLPTS